MQKSRLAVSALAVALSFGFASAQAIVRNDAVTIESLQDRLLDLRDQANNLQARADAEQRDMTADENNEFSTIMNEFESVEADIARREQLALVNDRMSASAGRRTEPAVTEEPDAGAAAPQNRSQLSRAQNEGRRGVPASPRSQEETGKWGFRSAGEYFGAILAASKRNGAVDPRLIKNAPTSYGSEGVGEDGGFAVPPDFRSTIISKVTGEDSLLSRTDQMTTSSNAITIPLDETTPWQASGGIQAYWEKEGGQKQQSKPQLTELTVKAHKVIALVPMTDELLQDAPAMASYVNRKAPEKIDYKVSEAIIKGTGVGQPLGILNSPGTIYIPAESGQAPDSVVMQNVMRQYYGMNSRSRARAVWLMNADAEAQLPYMQFINQGNGNAVPVYLPPGGLSGSPYATLLGRPIITHEAMPALGNQGDIVFADMSSYMTVVKTGGVRQDVSIHLFFDYDITAFRFVLRIGGQPWWNAPIERPDGQSPRGYFVGSSARA